MLTGPFLLLSVLPLFGSASAASPPVTHALALADSAPCRPRVQLFLFGPHGRLLPGDSLKLLDSLQLEVLGRFQEGLSQLHQLLERRNWEEESKRLRRWFEQEHKQWQRWLQEHRKFLDEELPRNQRQRERKLQEYRRRLERQRQALEQKLRELERELERLHQQLEHLRQTPLEL